MLSHGDTRNVLLFPGDPYECFQMTADAFDLADRLQTPIIVLSDLDLGMNDHLCEPLDWDDSRIYDRGKVLSAEDLDKLREKWGRYLDVDKDGICYRTFPGTHPKKGPMSPAAPPITNMLPTPKRAQPTSAA